MAAPLPAPEPPPAMAPPAAPRAAPATAPMAPSLIVSTVLFRCPACVAAYWLHALIAVWVGTARVAGAGELATRGAGLLEAVSATFLSLSLPDQLATTRPVASAVTITRAMPMAVSFHGFFQPPPSAMLALLPVDCPAVYQPRRKCLGEASQPGCQGRPSAQGSE